MNKVPDRKRLRREYLKKKADAYFTGAISSLFFVPALLITIVCIVGIVVGTISGIVYLVQHPAQFTEIDGATVIVGTMVALCTLGVATLGCAAFTYGTWEALKAAKRDVKIPYVPPVTPNTLPADEILVRGSTEPPVQQSEVLLRMVSQTQETPKEELLRVNLE